MFNKLKKTHDRLHLISTASNARQFRIMPIEDHYRFALSLLPAEKKISVQIRKKKSRREYILNFSNLPLFKDVLFEFHDDLAKNSYLVGDFCEWNPLAILMKKNEVEDRFKTSVSIEDKEVLYRFETDGEIRLDPKYVNEIFISKEGLCSKINLNRYQRRVEIENKGNKRFCGIISASANWVTVDRQKITILPADKEEIIVTIFPENMKIGENTCVIDIGSIDESKMKCAIKIQAVMLVYGIVPEIEERNLRIVDRVEEGDKVLKNLCIKVVGKGILKGKIYSSMGVICEDILVENLTPCETTIEKDIIIDTQKISHPQDNEIKATVVTDSYIWNKRCFPLTFIFEDEMIHLKTSLPVLLFSKMTSGGKKKRLSFMVTRSDNNRVDISISIPENLKKYVTVHKSKENQNQWEIEFDATKVNPEEISHISGMIKIKDKISNMEEQIPLIAEIGGNK